MGLFSNLKELFSAQKYIFKTMAEMDRQNAAYGKMTTEELALLSDDDLISAVLYRTDSRLDALLGKKKKGTPADWAEQFTGAQKSVYILSYFESDVQAGGMDYFLQQNPKLTRSVASAFEAIGASAHGALCQSFFAKHGYEFGYSKRLDLQEELTAFDEAYRQLPALELIIAPYLREHLAEF